MERDIDVILAELRHGHPGLRISQLQVKFPGTDDDGLWFIANGDAGIQLESSSGNAPFLLESSTHDDRLNAEDVPAAIALVKRELKLS